MNYVTLKDIENINKIGHELQKTYLFSWNSLARKTGWSTTTVKKYYDNNWYPGKYFQTPIKSHTVSKDFEYSGLYLLAQQVIENGQTLNLIKIGQSNNLKKRLESYKGMNPFAKCIDIFRCHPDDLDQLEQSYHLLLGSKNIRYGNTEWFICNDEEYQYWLTNKLNTFRKTA